MPRRAPLLLTTVVSQGNLAGDLSPGPPPVGLNSDKPLAWKAAGESPSGTLGPTGGGGTLSGVASPLAVLFPKAAAKDKLYMRDGDFTGDQVTLIATGISLQRGKLPESVLRASDEWLKRASKRDRRALRALSYGQG